jgi:hypothetical protein
MWIGKKNTSYLEHYTDHNAFTRNGVHYVQWLDVFINVQGRPVIFGCERPRTIAVASLSVYHVANQPCWNVAPQPLCE